MIDNNYIIKHWVLENSSSLIKYCTGALIGDGRFELVFVVGNGYQTIRENAIENIKEGIYIGGQMDAPMALEVETNTKLYMLKLEPWAAQLIADINFNEALNKTLSLDDINPELYKKLKNFNPEKQMEEITQTLLASFEEKQKKENLGKVLSACCKILDTGYIDFKEARDSCLLSTNLSTRSIETKFKRGIGLTPQQYSNGIRLRRISEFIKLHRCTPNLTDLSYEYGFYDQAHFNHIFKKFWGFSPKLLNDQKVLITNSEERFRHYTI